MIVYLRVVPGLQVAVEERDRPDLRLRPTIIGGHPQAGRGTVQEANAAAQNCGVRPGMSLAQARQYCPEAVFLLPDSARYEAVWEQICEILRGYTPLVEPIELGQAVCDLSGCEQLWGDPWNTAQGIGLQVRRTTGLGTRLGLASNRLVAELASMVDDGDAVTIVDGSEEAFLAGLPITLLPDVDPRLALTFKVLGLKTIGQFAGLPVAAVRQRFGATGERLHRYARGIDDRPILPPPPRPAISARHECDDGSIEEVADVIHRLAGDCAAELQHRGLAGKLVTFTLEWESESSPRSLAHPQWPALPDGDLDRPAEDEQEAALPVPYRIHSMLPQPGPLERRGEAPAALTASRPAHPSPAAPHETGGAGNRLPVPALPSSRTKTAVRTPISTAPPLVEQGRRLLLELWSQPTGDASARRARAVELEISEFEGPKQLSFAEMLRIDEVGRLGGRLANPRGALLEQERLLTARYGDPAFRHITQVDPESVLTERRFRWQAGLPPARKKLSRKKR